MRRTVGEVFSLASICRQAMSGVVTIAVSDVLVNPGRLTTHQQVRFGSNRPQSSLAVAGCYFELLIFK